MTAHDAHADRRSAGLGADALPCSAPSRRSCWSARFLTPAAVPLRRRTGMREVFVGLALLLVVGIALLMQLVGLSSALGTFLAGVVLAESEYRHELETDIEPFKGLLLGLFFIAVGAGIDFAVRARAAAAGRGLVVGFLALEARGAVRLWRARCRSRRAERPVLFACSCAQGGEFGFVRVPAAGAGRRCSTRRCRRCWSAAVALSMPLTPLLLVLDDRVAAAAPRQPGPTANPTRSTSRGGAGHHRRLRPLRADRRPPAPAPTASAHRARPRRRPGRGAAQVRLARSFYGDATRLDLLAAAGAAHARLFVCAMDDPARSLEIVDLARRHFPHLRILARALTACTRTTC